MNGNQFLGHFCRFSRQVERNNQQIHAQQNDHIQHCHGGVGQHHHSLDVHPCLLKFMGADTLPDHGNHAQTNGIARQHFQGSHGIANSICGNGYRAKGADQTQEDQFTQLKNASFQTVGDTHIKNLLHQVAVPFKLMQLGIGNGAARILQSNLHDGCAQNTAYKGSNGGACNAHIHDVDQQGITDYVDNVHYQRGLQRNLCVAHGAQQCSRCVIHGKERIADSGPEQIGSGTFHYVRFDGAVNGIQHRNPENQTEGHNGSAGDQNNIKKHFRRAACFLRVFLP